MRGGRAPSPTFQTLANGFAEFHRWVPLLRTVPFTPVRYTLKYPARREGDERPPRGTVVKLYVYLYDDLAIEVGVGDDNHDEPLTIHPAARDVSAAWTTPTGEQLNRWLTALLPENGQREAWTVAASAARLEAGLTPEPRNAAEILWGNTEAEYPGAVSFAREARAPTWSNAYATLTDEEIGTRLLEAAVTAAGARRGRPTTHDERRSSLSGVRGKIGVTLFADGRWGAARDDTLNGWIAKREFDNRFPGEAGIEAICQRSCDLVGLRAAETRARVFGDQQAVLSKRADRRWDPATNRMVPVHQEELCQAWGWPAALKYDRGRVRGPGWQEADQVLADAATDPAAARGQLTRLLAAAIGLGHADLHRRNAGVQHDLKAARPVIGLAPVYDVSSGSAVRRRITFDLPFGIAGKHRFEEIGPIQWITHARNTGQDPDVVIAIVNDVVRGLPEAIASARDRARSEDENIDQLAVDRRVEDLLDWAARRKRGWETMLGQARAKRARGLEPQSAELGARIRALDEAHGFATPVDVIVDDDGTMEVSLDPAAERGVAEQTIPEIRTLALALVEAGRQRPEDLTEVKAQLERERQSALARNNDEHVHGQPGGKQLPDRASGIPGFRARSSGTRTTPRPAPSENPDKGPEH